MKKIILDLKKPVKDLLSGKELEPKQTIGEALAVHLSMSSTANAAKSMLWAIDFHKNIKVEMDEIDFGILYEFCNGLKVPNMFKVQLLECLDTAKEQSKTKNK